MLLAFERTQIEIRPCRILFSMTVQSLIKEGGKVASMVNKKVCNDIIAYHH